MEPNEAMSFSGSENREIAQRAPLLKRGDDFFTPLGFVPSSDEIGRNFNSHAAVSPSQDQNIRVNAMPDSSTGSILSSDAISCSTGIFALPATEPENPVAFKAALEFIPKNFDGRNMPVNRFINIVYLLKILLHRRIDIIFFF